MIPLFDLMDEYRVEPSLSPEDKAYKRAEYFREFGIPDERISVLLKSSKLPDVDYSTLPDPPSEETRINNLIDFWESERSANKKLASDPLNHIDVELRDLRREKADILRSMGRDFEAYLIDKETNEAQRKYHQYYIDYLSKHIKKGVDHPNTQGILENQIKSLEIVKEKIANTKRPEGRDPKWAKYDPLPDWVSDDAARLAFEGEGAKEESSKKRSKSQRERRARESEERESNQTPELFAKENSGDWYPQISFPGMGTPEHELENLKAVDKSDYDKRLEEWKEKQGVKDKPKRGRKKGTSSSDGKLFRNVSAPRPMLPTMDVASDKKSGKNLINKWFKKHKPPRYV